MTVANQVSASSCINLGSVFNKSINGKNPVFKQEISINLFAWEVRKHRFENRVRCNSLKWLDKREGNNKER